MTDAELSARRARALAVAVALQKQIEALQARLRAIVALILSDGVT